jgi:hypothetical protein
VMAAMATLPGAEHDEGAGEDGGRPTAGSAAGAGSGRRHLACPDEVDGEPITICVPAKAPAVSAAIAGGE